MSEPKFYVVWKGRSPGIYVRWTDCEAQVKEFPGAQFKAFAGKAEAEQAFAGEYASFAGKDKKPAVQKKPGMHGGHIRDSYCVDASCIGSPGPVEYQCVHTTTKKKIFKIGPLQGGSCNIGEFLAIVHALALFKKKGITAPVYSDSQIAIGWVAKKQCKTCVERTDENSELFILIDRAERWLATNEHATRVLKWDTKHWGEIPADYGRK